MKPLLISSGEPAGIGPDLCLALSSLELPVVVLGDMQLLQARANELNQPITFLPYQPGRSKNTSAGNLTVLNHPLKVPVTSGILNPANGSYVVELLTRAAGLCGNNEFSALVTAPVHKANINAAGIPFTGHTEFLAEFFKSKTVVMLLACEIMKVALITTHLPLRQVADSLSVQRIIEVITVLNQSLLSDFKIHKPFIKVAGLNPHAGESGYLGREEIDIIAPALDILRNQGINIDGPLPADTMFVQQCDAYVTMYHDQGLSVLKYAGFNQSVNITLGLPIIRTSVDHGTALDLAGTGRADSGSMIAAVQMAINMAQNRG